MSSRSAPSLSVSIKAIKSPNSKESLTLDKLFTYPDELSDDTKKYLDTHEIEKRYWLYGQLMKWLAEKPAAVVEKLYSKYEELIKRRDESLKGVLEAPNV